jgi:biopolymer transport protein ExbD
MIEIEIERHSRRPKDLNVTSLIDVMLTMLIFFLVAGRLEQYEVLKVDPPTAEAGEELNQGPVVVVLGRHDEIVVEDELLSVEEVGAKIRDALEAYPNRLITVKADAHSKAERLIEVLDRINEAGGKNLTIATQQP